MLALAADPGMTPPVALLGYAPDEPRISAFWPFAVFSPEWQALTWAHDHGVPVRFCDLPAGMVLAHEEKGEPGEELTGRSEEKELSSDPIGRLAAAAGYDDPERWWDDLIESRLDGGSPFEALADAMAELRADAPEEPLREQRREAHMRQVLRAALKETDGPVAVVCGAWHAPALREPLPPAVKDAALLRGHPQAEGGARVGAVDALAAGGRVRVRRGHHLAGLVPPPVHHARPDRDPVDDTRRRGAPRP